MIWKRYGKWVLAIGLALMIKICALFPDAVEKYYANGIYPFIARVLRILFGWIPFSIGDIFYISIFVWLIVRVISFLRKLFTGRISTPYLLYVAKRICWFCLMVYIVFNLLWGLNYDRRGIAYQLKLNVQPYSTADLQNALQFIVYRLNELNQASLDNRAILKKKSQLFNESFQAYGQLYARDSFFLYKTISVKPSIISYLGNYLGFTGYYNPFSGEAQVNTTVPIFIQPFTSCHEIGHQLGYAKENEANFAGYLAANVSKNPSYGYSAYFDLYVYAATELYMRDSTLLKPLREQLKPSVREDFKTLRKFFTQYGNPIEPYIRKLYGGYLKANNQPQGLLTYNEVVAWFIAYQKKYGLMPVEPGQ
jgi:Protein of unknown function (DUF3810)